MRIILLARVSINEQTTKHQIPGLIEYVKIIN